MTSKNYQIFASLPLGGMPSIFINNDITTKQNYVTRDNAAALLKKCSSLSVQVKSSQVTNSHNTAAATKRRVVTAVQIAKKASATLSKKEAPLEAPFSCLRV
jgi:hypothetical protein